MKKLYFLTLLLLQSALLFAQKDVTVRGVVTDAADGQPLIGVAVVVEQTSKSTMTDVNGMYEIKAQEGQTIIFQYAGMITTTQKAPATGVLDVQMETDAQSIDEVVVIGYGTQKKALVTGANANVKGDAIAGVKQTTAMEGLQGMVAGLNIVRNNGAPGSGTKVTIRGAGTTGSSSPLYIVDGVALGSIDYLSPSDIESIDVLKDAASAAIYGARAANGVVLVTTKKGKLGGGDKLSTTVSYDGYYGMQNIYKKLPMLNAQEYMFIMDEALSNSGMPLYNWQDAIVNGNANLDEEFGAGVGAAYGNYVWNKLQSGWTGTDWVAEESMKNAPVQNHSINITGSAQDFTYSAGFTYYDQSGILGGSIYDAGMKRLTARLNTEIVLFKTSEHNILTLGENFTYNNSKNRGAATGNMYWNDLRDALVANPLLPVYWDNENIASSTYGFAPALWGIGGQQQASSNPVASMYFRNNYSWNNGNTAVGNVYAVLEPIKGLKLRSSLGINAWWGNGRSYSPKYNIGRKQQNLLDGVSMSAYIGSELSWTNTLSYDFTVADDHKFNVLIGSEMVKSTLNFNVGGWKANLLYDESKYAYLDNTAAPEVVGQISTDGKDWAAQGGGLMSYMGRLSYNYKEKYMLDATFRADGSSNFAPDKRWGFFPSVSAGWNFTEESFMENTSDWLTFGKLRASWGQNGNHNIGGFVYQSNIGYDSKGYFFGYNKEVPAMAAFPSNIPNPEVTWETSEQINVGLDAKFFRSRLGLSFDWYQKTTKHWLVVAPILGTSGAGAPYINGGDVRNSGVELLLSWNDRAGDFSYGVTLTGAYNKNEVTRLANAEGVINGNSNVLGQGTSFVSRVEVGKPIGYFYGFKTDGIFQNQAEVDAYVDKNGKPIVIGIEAETARKPGDVRFVDTNGDGVIDEADKVMLGKPTPDFEAGLQLNFDYKGIFLNASLVGKFGMQVMQSYRSFADSPLNNYTTAIFDRWHGEGTSNRLPRLSYQSVANSNLVSDIYMHDADYVRLSNLTLGYRFDRLLKNVKWMRSASVYVSVNNLFTITGYDGMDPEIGYNGDNGWAGGIDLGLYPLPRIVMFGINITL